MSERDFAAAILTEITSDNAIGAALEIWGEAAELPDRDLLELVISEVAAFAIGNVLARRQSEAARTGPWEGPQEEPGYPGSLLPPGWPERGAP